MAEDRVEYRQPNGNLTGYSVRHGDQIRNYDPAGRPRGTDIIKPNGNIERRTQDGRLLGVIVPTK